MPGSARSAQAGGRTSGGVYGRTSTSLLLHRAKSGSLVLSQASGVRAALQVESGRGESKSPLEASLAAN